MLMTCILFLGLATLKIRVPCKKSSGGTKLLTVKIKLTEPTSNLMTSIGNEMVTQNSIKLISSGRVLDPEKSLAEQNIKNFQQILALESKNETDAENQTYNRVTKIRKDAELLMKSKHSSFFKLEDKNGETVYLPENERMSIMMALLLYEKGRAEMKKENYSDALILFLEADRELQSCQANIEKSIDNVAFLNLDIAWCYLQLKSIMQLPDAERRLTICEDNLKKSYGVNFERAQVSERCLVLRLKLLQGILYFHLNRRQESSLFLSCAERELSELKVDEEKVTTLLQMGYNANESIIALRNTYNTSIDSAVNFILDRRSKFKEARKTGKKEAVVGEALNALGFDVNPKSVCQLTEMGFNRELAALALQKSKGDLTEALNLLQNDFESLKQELSNVITPSSELIENLRAFGFDESLVTNILKQCVNDFDKALDLLLEMQQNGQIPTEIVDVLNQIPTTSTASTSNDTATASTTNSSNNKKRRTDDDLSPEEKQAIYDDLRNDLEHIDEDDQYLLDFGTLQKEELLIQQYKRALGE